MGFGQYASAIVRDALDSQIADTDTTAGLLARMAQTLAVGSSTDSVARLEAISQQAQPVRLVIQTGGQLFTVPATGEIRSLPDWMEAGFKGVIESDGSFFVAATAAALDTRVLAYRPLDHEAWSRLTRGTVSVTVVPTTGLAGSGSDPNVRIDLRSGRSFIRRDGVEQPLETSGPIAAPPGGFPDKELAWMLPINVRSVAGHNIGVLLVLGSPRSLVFSRLFSSLGPAAIYVGIVMAMLAFSVLVVELVSMTWSIRLTRSITRSVHDLYEATQQVAAGNLAHRAPVRGFDQLAELSGSFNTMTGRVQQLIAEVKEKEKIEAELEIARRVQLELFPKKLPALSTLELAGVCMPSRFVSGDYYDCVTLGDNWTAIVLGDVSGKGIGAALVMATLQAALHAQLRFGGGSPMKSNGEPPSTARLTERLSEQLY